MKIKTTYLICLLLLFSTGNHFGQILNAERKCVLQLSEGVKVACYQAAFKTPAGKTYYYLPVNLRFSTKNGQPEYSFLLYKDKGKQVKGAIVHWLLTWGLTKKQLLEATKLLKQAKGKNATLAGAVLPELYIEKNKMAIEGNAQMAMILRRSVTSMGRIPLLANTKTAASFKLNAADASVFKKNMEQNTGLKNTLISMYFKLQFKSARTNSIINQEYKLTQNLQQLKN